MVAVVFADVPCNHPSISKQHAVLQYRELEQDAEDGIDTIKTVEPYIMDLETTNGTFLKGKGDSDFVRIEGARYYQLHPSDVVKFGKSTRDYVLLVKE